MWIFGDDFWRWDVDFWGWLLAMRYGFLGMSFGDEISFFWDDFWRWDIFLAMKSLGWLLGCFWDVSGMLLEMCLEMTNKALRWKLGMKKKSFGDDVWGWKRVVGMFSTQELQKVEMSATKFTWRYCLQSCRIKTKLQFYGFFMFFLPKTVKKMFDFTFSRCSVFFFESQGLKVIIVRKHLLKRVVVLTPLFSSRGNRLKGFHLSRTIPDPWNFPHFYVKIFRQKNGRDRPRNFPVFLGHRFQPLETTLNIMGMLCKTNSNEKAFSLIFVA